MCGIVTVFCALAWRRRAYVRAAHARVVVIFTRCKRCIFSPSHACKRLRNLQLCTLCIINSKRAQLRESTLPTSAKTLELLRSKNEMQRSIDGEPAAALERGTELRSLPDEDSSFDSRDGRDEIRAGGRPRAGRFAEIDDQRDLVLAVARRFELLRLRRRRATETASRQHLACGALQISNTRSTGTKRPREWRGSGCATARQWGRIAF